ncbi:Uma2 family endonuclease [Kitasatospora sp. MAP12-15]|uniref:Uma2 family endonuclease n=1 Tax=unclassified Kitasatospora TaxID=2633591 RepID=UPI002476641B|nr:Uma2 family endonuclease [Kitasatospora sp. MAP12-44]MDH6109549.1 Uma2 family endonuclease [Kitasatospora sp. MAP12-44]
MSAAALEQPCEQPCEEVVEQPSDELTLLEAADLISDRLAGYRVEILGSQILVTPPADGPHGRSLTRCMRPLVAAGLDDEETNVIQAIGVWLPDGPSDYAIPDLALVDSDFEDHPAEFNCYDPSVFRLVLEITSSNRQTDVMTKPAAYATAGIPVYVIVDRTKRRVMVLTEPKDGEYRVHTVHRPGEQFELPESIGALVTMDVDSMLGPVK